VQQHRAAGARAVAVGNRKVVYMHTSNWPLEWDQQQVTAYLAEHCPHPS
jgi:hypothetical protein